MKKRKRFNFEKRAKRHIQFVHNKKNQNVNRIFIGEYERFLNETCLGPENSPKWKLKKQFRSSTYSRELKYGTFLRANYPEKFQEQLKEFNKNIRI